MNSHLSILLLSVASAQALCAAEPIANLLPPVQPFSVSFQGSKTTGTMPTAPWRSSKPWKSDKPGSVTYGPRPDEGNVVTIWSEADYGPGLWSDPLPLEPGTYTLSWEAKSVGPASWRVKWKFFDVPFASLVDFARDPDGAKVTAGDSGMARSLSYEPDSAWRSLSYSCTVLAKGARFNVDFALNPGGLGQNAPVLLRNLQLKQTGTVTPEQVERALADATRERRLQELREFYGTVSGTIVSASAENLVLTITRLYPYTRLSDPQGLVGSSLTVLATPATFVGSSEEISNLACTAPPRDQATAYFSALKPGDRVEVGIYGDISGGQAKLARLPGPATQALGAAPQRQMGAQLDEAKVTTNLHVSDRTGSDRNTGASAKSPVKTIERALALARPLLDAGTGVRIRIAAGVYRPSSTLRLSDYDKPAESRLAPLSATAQKTPLIIEGEGGGTVSIRGSVTAGFEPGTWTLVDQEKRIYKHAWDLNYGTKNEGYYAPQIKNVLLHRRELLAVNGQVLRQVLLEDFDFIDPSGTKFEAEIGLITAGGGKPVGKTGYIYKGFRDPLTNLQPGEFGVAEMNPDQADHPHPNSMFLRLPEHVTSLDQAVIEVGSLSTLLRLQDKSNVVLRNLVFEHAASFWNAFYEKSAIDTNGWGSFSPSRNWLFDGVITRHNRGAGLTLAWVRDATIRNSDFSDNGNRAVNVNFVDGVIVEDSHVDRNNTLGRAADYALSETGGMWFSGQNALFRRNTFNDNFGRGFRSDFGFTDVVFEKCEFNRNVKGGVFNEISWGPAIFRDCRISDNLGKNGLLTLAVDRITLEGCRITNNQGGQIEFYISPKRDTSGRQLPLAELVVKTKPRAKNIYDGINPDAFFPRGYIRDFTVKDCIVTATGNNPLIGRIMSGGDAIAYGKMIRGQEFFSAGNTFWNPDNAAVFEDFTEKSPYKERTLVDLAAWQTITNKDGTSRWAAPQ